MIELAPPPSIRDAAAQVRLVALDVDGVLTDGVLRYGPDGEYVKAFHVHDGLGIRMLARAGLDVAIISGRSGPALERRLTELEVRHRYLGRRDKGAALEELVDAAKVNVRQVAFVGDDVLDLPVLRRVGVSVAVANAHPLVLREVAWTTGRAGGTGAVREVADGLLAARGRLESAYAELLEHAEGRG